jgi:hypothetical protein
VKSELALPRDTLLQNRCQRRYACQFRKHSCYDSFFTKSKPCPAFAQGGYVAKRVIAQDKAGHSCPAKATPAPACGTNCKASCTRRALSLRAKTEGIQRVSNNRHPVPEPPQAALHRTFPAARKSSSQTNEIVSEKALTNHATFDTITSAAVVKEPRNGDAFRDNCWCSSVGRAADL